MLSLLLVSCGKKGLPDLKETYRLRDKKAFGGNIAWRMMSNSYPASYVSVKSEPISETFSWISDTAGLYVLVAPSLSMNDNDVDVLMDYVYRGNNVFISAAEIDSAILRKLHTRQQPDMSWMNIMDPMPYVTTTAKLVKEAAPSMQDFSYFYYPVRNSFILEDAEHYRVAGFNGMGRPNFVMFNWGRGKLYLHCEPRLLSNYFLLTKENSKYFSQILQLFPEDPEHLYWDDYYNVSGRKNRSSRSNIIFENEALLFAFWLSVLLLILYILFNGKRRQRIVPIIKPVQNSSVAFAEAVAGLYLKEKNNKSIADKVITYFNEFIRTRYFLNTGNPNNEFIETLSRKSGIELSKIDTLYRTIHQVGQSAVVDDFQLLNLNEQIQNFYKNKN